MTERLDQLREAIRAPLPLAYHPLYRFYEGGSLTRTFRGLPGRRDDWWSADWVGSCTLANNDDPDGRPQGMSSVDLPGIGRDWFADAVRRQDNPGIRGTPHATGASRSRSWCRRSLPRANRGMTTKPSHA